MSDYRSKSSPQANALSNMEGHLALATSRPVTSEGTGTRSRHQTSNSVLFNVTGVAVVGPQSSHTGNQSTQRSTSLPPDTHHPSAPRGGGVPTLVASGLVSLPPASVAVSQPPKINVPDESTSSTQESMVASKMDNTKLSVTSANRAGSPYSLQSAGKDAGSRGSSPRTVQRIPHRLSPNNVAHSSVPVEISGERILAWYSVPTESKHTTALSDVQGPIPIVTIQRNSTLTTNTLNLPNSQTDTLTEKQHTSPVHHRASPVPRRNSPLQQRASPLPQRISPQPRRVSPLPQSQRVSPQPQRVSPQPQRVSPVQQRVSPLPRRVSPIHQRELPFSQTVSIYKISSGPDRHNPSPIPGSKAPQVKLTSVSTVTAQGQPNNSTCQTTCTSVRTTVNKPILCDKEQWPEGKQKDFTARNPFLAAMTAATLKSEKTENKPSPTSSANDKSHSFHIINKPQSTSCVVKVEKVGESVVAPVNIKRHTLEANKQFIIEPICKSSCSMQSTISQPQVVLSQQRSSLIMTASTVSEKKTTSSSLAANMPLLSNIMGLIPDGNSCSGSNLQTLKAEDNKPLVDAMPRLFPEIAVLGTQVKSEKPLLTDKIKEEEDGSKLTPISNPFCLRLRNLNNFPSCHTNAYKPTYRSQGMAIHRAKTGCIMNAARSLDLLRSNLQKYINKEIDAVIQTYINDYFKPGIENIRKNNGHTAVSDDHIQAVCQQILEEAKKMYMTGSRCNTPDPNDNISESGSLAPPESRDIREKKLDLFRIKKRRGSSDSEASITKKPKRKGRPPLKLGNGRTTAKFGKHDPVKKEGPKWDPDRLLPETQFVMGARANKALGLGAQRGRLYIKHPDLFKYAGDQEDKNWLHENHHMPATGGKAYLLVVDDVLSLAETEEYRDSPGLMLDEIVGFTVPDWMREKMKLQMKTLRTDGPKASRIKASTQLQTEVPADVPGTKPFATPDKSDQQPSPSTTENMDMASTDQEVDDLPSVSPLNISGGFTSVGHSPDISPAPSVGYEEVDEEPPGTAPFELGEPVN